MRPKLLAVAGVSARRHLGLGVLVAVTALIAAACVAPAAPPPSNNVTATVIVDGQTVKFSVPAGLTLDVGTADLGALPPVPFFLTAVFGAFDITVGGVTPGDVVRVTVTLPSAVESVRKLLGGVWDPFAPDGMTGATLSSNGKTVTLDLQDGGRGDNDGAANGTIVDPPVFTTPTCIDTSGTGNNYWDIKFAGWYNVFQNMTVYIGSDDGTCSGTGGLWHASLMDTYDPGHCDETVPFGATLVDTATFPSSIPAGLWGPGVWLCSVSA